MYQVGRPRRDAPAHFQTLNQGARFAREGSRIHDLANSDRSQDDEATGLCLCVLTCLASTGYAADYTATGTVSALHSEDSSRRAESTWFSLAGVDSLGTCKASTDGHVVFLLADDKEGRRMFEIALASKASGAPLKISVDDTVTGASGFCYVTAME